MGRSTRLSTNFATGRGELTATSGPCAVSQEDLVDTATARLERRRSIIPTLTPSCLGPRRSWLQVWDASQNVLKLNDAIFAQTSN